MTTPGATPPPAGTTEYPAVQLYEASNDGYCNLTMYVDDTTRLVVGWHLVNGLPYPVQGDVSEGSFSATQVFPPGADVQGNVPRRLQWNYDDGGTMSYALTPRR